ncbi:MAG: 2-C-methyl-D-erythritol 4-phosphate cytidylyltransferase [Ignavibacteria bacterium]|nr:2-C-methyl-D-erythritol 4-phosphate cytidylyltransferase [Ignavibacteria bacterium]
MKPDETHVMPFAVVIPAAGVGRRMDSTTPKQYLQLDGIPVIIRTLTTVLSIPQVSVVVVALHKDDSHFKRICVEFGLDVNRIQTVIGGAERQNSIENAILSLDFEGPTNPQIVLIHDAVRPFASARLFLQIALEASKSGAAVPALPTTDTIKEVNDANFVVQTLNRSALRHIQTPQGFRLAPYKIALQSAIKSGINYPDDAAVFEAGGFPVACITGELNNIKITNQADLAIAERILSII